MLPIALHDLLTSGLQRMQQHPAHDLALGYRQRIYAALGPKHDQTVTATALGQRRRVILAMVATRKVLPLWDARYATHSYAKTPYQMLTYAEDLLEEKPVNQRHIRTFST